MGSDDERPGPASERIVERGERYDHETHGRVEVTGIWKGVNRVDKARQTDEKDVLIVRYSTATDDDSVDELTDTLSEFLEQTE